MTEAAPVSHRRQRAAGAVWVFYGPLSGQLDLDDAEVEGAEIRGSNAADYLGIPATIAEGLTGTGSVDLILGAQGADWGSSGAGGAVYLFEAF